MSHILKSASAQTIFVPRKELPEQLTQLVPVAMENDQVVWRPEKLVEEDFEMEDMYLPEYLVSQVESEEDFKHMSISTQLKDDDAVSELEYCIVDETNSSNNSCYKCKDEQHIDVDQDHHEQLLSSRSMISKTKNPLEFHRPFSSYGRNKRFGRLCYQMQMAQALNVEKDFTSLAAIEYYDNINFLQLVPRVVNLGVRTFLNAGWNETVEVPCVDGECGSYFTSLSLYIVPIRERCLSEQELVLESRDMVYLPGASESSYFKTQCRVRNPCSAENLQIERETNPEWTVVRSDAIEDGHTKVTFHVDSRHRMDVSERQKWFHRHHAMCVLNSSPALEENKTSIGNLKGAAFIGYAKYHMESTDVQAFVFFVLFFSVVLPLICGTTFVMHRAKCILIRKRMRMLQFLLERRQLEDELIEIERERRLEDEEGA